MAIDTSNKRKSVINFSVPGGHLMPIPDGTVDIYNRRQVADSYAIEAVTIPATFWIQDKRDTRSWVQDSNLSNNWIQDTDVLEDTWVQDKDMPQ